MAADRPVRPDANAADFALGVQLMHEASAAALAVISDGVPYAAFTAPALADDGAPLVLASDLSAHGRALNAALVEGDAASLMYAGPVNPDQPLATARLTVQGVVRASIDEDRIAYLNARPESALYIDFGDMRLYRLALSGAHLVAGFGRAVTLDPVALLRSAGKT